MDSFFVKKYFPKKFLSRHNMQPNTLTRREYNGKIYGKNILKNHVGYETGSGSEAGYE
jgi:hypothetical protein